DRAGGNPFYVRGSGRLPESEGALVAPAAVPGGGRDGLGRRGARVPPRALVALAEVPEGVRDVLRRRLARLPQSAVSVLRLAAVVGREAEVDVLVAAADT